MKHNKKLTLLSAALLLSSAQAAPLTGGTTPIDQTALTRHWPDHGVESSRHQHQDKNEPQAQSRFKPQPRKSFAEKATATCNIAAFTTSNTTTLISEIKTQGVDCINQLFSASAATQQAVYDSTKMSAVANEAKNLSATYAGGGDPRLQALYLWLRAGLYVEFYNDAVTFDAAVYTAVKSAIDAFVANSHFYDNNDEHGKTLGEVVITMDSVDGQDTYLPVAKQWLSRWSASYADKWYLRNAVNGFFTLLFRGQWNDNYKALVADDTTLVDILKNFSLGSWMLGTDSEFLIANAGRELGRLKAYGGSIQTSVDSALNRIFSTYQVYGYGDAVWLGAADTATYYVDCSRYNICNYKTQLETLALSQTHVCSATIKIRSQDLTPVQQNAACAQLEFEESYFHGKLNTNNTPVAQDNNTQLQINIFNSSDDYKKYAGPIFDMSTDNGGMYLEGNPADPNNIPNFVAYEASYANPDHYIWNLEHEYVHYLDGRFDMYGDFNNPTETVVWWAEGLAEYVSHQDNNQAAIDTINDGTTYDLGAVFATTYDGFDQDRIYRWGYLAVRFMFERHNDQVDQMLAATRVGDWSSYKALVDQWSPAYGAEFTQWTEALAAGSANTAPSANANGPYSGQTGTDIVFSSNGSSDSDGSIVGYLWDFGDGSSAQGADVSHSYASAGSYTVTLTVTDNSNATGTSTALVTVTDGPSGSILSNGIGKNVSGAQGSDRYFTLEVPSGAQDLSFVINGGSGDADLYVKFGQAPTLSDYDCRPWLSGNSESCPIVNVQAGTYHVLLHGYNSYDNVVLTGSYSAPSIPDACANQAPIDSGSLEQGSVTCLGSADPIWLSIAGVNAHSSIAISVGNGSGDVFVDYKTGGWPSETDNDGSAHNAGSSQCIYIDTLSSSSDYWGYFKITGGGSGASIVVDFDTAGCR